MLLIAGMLDFGGVIDKCDAFLFKLGIGDSAGSAVAPRNGPIDKRTKFTMHIELRIS